MTSLQEWVYDLTCRRLIRVSLLDSLRVGVLGVTKNSKDISVIKKEVSRRLYSLQTHNFTSMWTENLEWD